MKTATGLLLGFAVVLGGGASTLSGACGPFSDVAADGFCPFVLEIFTLGITTGTTATTYDPTGNVTRLQMAAFLSRTVDGVLKRGNRRAALDQFWIPQASGIGVVALPSVPHAVKSDGADLWVADTFSVVRVRASDAKVLETWTAEQAYGVLVAKNRVFATAYQSPGVLYQIDPSQAPGAATAVASNLGALPFAAAFDGSRVWTSNSANSISIVTPTLAIPWTVTTVTTGFDNPGGILFDGANIWVTNFPDGTLLKVDAAGAVLQTVTVGSGSQNPVYDGANLWVPGFFANTVAVVKASTGAVLATLTGNGLDAPWAAAFDGQRVLVTNDQGNSVSLFKAADLTPLGSVSTGPATEPGGVCSDGIHFWISLTGFGQLARF